MSTTIRRDEWLAELERVMTADQKRQGGGGFTARELQAKYGLSKTRLDAFLAQLLAEQRLVARHEARPSRDGCSRPVPTYSIRSAPVKARR